MFLQKRNKGNFKLGFVALISLIAVFAVAGLFNFVAAKAYEPATQVSAAWTGDGSAANPYFIKTAQDLIDLSNNVNSGNAYSGKFFKQTADITLTGNFNPIGNSASRVFAGNFNGNGYSISNLKVNVAGSAGLFGVIENGSVSGVHLINADVRGGAETGGIAGVIKAASGADITIYNCSVSGYVQGTYNLGGLFGRVESTGTHNGLDGGKILINTCFNVALVASTLTSAREEGNNVGGIVGFVKTANAENGSGSGGRGGNAGNITIINNYNRGELRATNGTMVNGIAGYVDLGNGGNGTKGSKGKKGGFWLGKGEDGLRGGTAGDRSVLTMQFNYSTGNITCGTGGKIASYKQSSDGSPGEGGDGGDGGTFFGSGGNSGPPGYGANSGNNTINNNFHTTTSGGAGSVAIGDPVSEAFMKNVANLIYWDFSAVWTMDSAFTSLNDGFPVIKTNLPNFLYIDARSNNTSLGTVTGNGIYDRGAQVTLTALAIGVAHFTGWQENGVVISTNPTYTFNATGNRIIVAMFSTDYNITVTTATSGGTVLGGGSYAYGTNAYLFATPNAGYKFAGWDKVGASGTISTDNPYVVTVDSNATYRASFALLTSQVAIRALSSTPDVATNTVAVQTSGGAASNGIFDKINANNARVVAVAGPGYTFDGWYEGNVKFSTNLTAPINTNDDHIVIAVFKPIEQNYTVTVTTKINGTTQGNPITLDYSSGQTVVLHPLMFGSNAFLNWQENTTTIVAGVDAEGKYTFIMTGNRSLTLNLDSTKATITLQKSTTDTGITLTGAGTFNVSTSRSVSFTNTSPGLEFVGWMENGAIVSASTNYTFTLTVNRSLVAVFQTKSFTVSITTMERDNPASAITASSSHLYGSTVSYDALALTTHAFVGWYNSSGTLIQSAGPVYSFTVTGNISLTLKYWDQAVTMLVQVLPVDGTVGGTINYSGTASWNGNYLSTTQASIQLTAVQGNDFLFSHWLKNGVELAPKTAAITITPANGDVYQAVMRYKSVNLAIQYVLDSVLKYTYYVDIPFNSTYTLDAYALGNEVFERFGPTAALLEDCVTVVNNKITIEPTSASSISTLQVRFVSSTVSDNHVTVGVSVYEMFGSEKRKIHSYERLVHKGENLTLTCDYDTPYKFLKWVRLSNNQDIIPTSAPYSHTHYSLQANENYELILVRESFYVTVNTYPAEANGAFVNFASGYKKNTTAYDFAVTCKTGWELAYFTKNGLPIPSTSITITPNTVYNSLHAEDFIFMFGAQINDCGITAVFKKITVVVTTDRAMPGYSLLSMNGLGIYNIGDVVTISTNGDEAYPLSSPKYIPHNMATSGAYVNLSASMNSINTAFTFTVTEAIIYKHQGYNYPVKDSNGNWCVKLDFSSSNINLTTYIGFIKEDFASGTWGNLELVGPLSGMSGNAIPMETGLIIRDNFVGYGIWKWEYARPGANFSVTQNWDLNGAKLIANSFTAPRFNASIQNGLMVAYFKQLYIVENDFSLISSYYNLSNPNDEIYTSVYKPSLFETTAPQSVLGAGTGGSTALGGNNNAYSPYFTYLYEVSNSSNTTSSASPGLSTPIVIDSIDFTPGIMGGVSTFVADSTFKVGSRTTPSIIFKVKYGELPTITFRWVAEADAGTLGVSGGMRLSANIKDAGSISRQTIGGSYVLTATSFEGFRFVGWNVNGELVKGSNTYVVSESGANVIAIYESQTAFLDAFKWVAVGVLISALSAAIVIFAIRRSRSMRVYGKLTKNDDNDTFLV